jgi:hypothetical protein
MASSANQKILLGEAAEHLVISRLLICGDPASQTPRNWKADDVIVAGGISIQVKAPNTGPKGGWIIGHNVRVSESRWYALVDLKNKFEPVVYLLPSAVIENALSASGTVYLKLHPNQQAGTGVPKIYDPWPSKIEVPGYPSNWLSQYLENWEQLPLPPPT